MFFLRLFSLCIGVSLLGLNFAGFLVPLRNSAIYQEQQTSFKEDIVLTEEQLYNAVIREGQSDEEYVIKVNDAVNKGIAHYWEDEGINKYNLRIPVQENYLLFFLTCIHVYPTLFDKYEYCNYKKVVKRGVGLCSQQAIIVSEILKEHSIDSKIIDLGGHVVATAQVDKVNNIWWVVDPDYGVVVRHDVKEIERSPEIISTYYVAKGYDLETVSRLIEVYGKEGNKEFTGGG